MLSGASLAWRGRGRGSCLLILWAGEGKAGKPVFPLRRQPHPALEELLRRGSWQPGAAGFLGGFG